MGSDFDRRNGPSIMPDWPVCWWNRMRGGDGIRWLYKLVVAEFGEIGVTDGIVLNGL